ncbi:T6SS effector BTH_I2691 family protein [Serratia sp. D1N4]
MSTQKGCKFCIRRGLPLLPARPAVISQSDTLPHLPASITVPTVAQGETAWTARLLREGFLYIWAESGKRWINYFATSEGYYYPLPENGDVPQDIVNGKVKPCITQPAELASASLITLPVKPAGMKNGVFWFVWSEVEWTEAVRKKHEDAAYRSKSMQSFDMDAWINGGKAKQTLPIAKLSDTIAEYSRSAAQCKAKQWTRAPWKKVNPAAGENIKLAADALYAGKGAILLLEDAPAILQDLSAVIDYDLQEQVYKKPEYQRELALASAITGLKESMKRQFQRDYIEKRESEERIALYGPFGYSANPDVPDNMYTAVGDSQMHAAAEKKWKEYEQYYDPNQVTNFQDKFNQVLKQYNDSIVSPRTEMYLAWFKSQTLLGYFQHNFDTRELKSGIEYVQTLNYCIAGMQDKVGVLRHFTDLLSGTPTDATNILARALVLNQDVLAEKLAEATKGFSDWFSIPWNGIADAFREGIEKKRNNAAGVAGIFIGLLSGILTRKITQALESNQVYGCLVAMGALTNKALVPLEKTGTYRQFVAEVVKQLAKESGLDGKAHQGSLRGYVRRELRRLRIDGLPMEGVETKRFLVMVDIDKVHELAALPPKERAAALSKLLRTSADVEAQQFSRWQGAVQRGVRKAGEAMPFTLGVISGVLQVAALYTTADLKNKKTLTADQKEAHSRFWAGVAGLGSTTLSVIETGIKQFRLFADATSRMRVFSSETFMKWFIGYGGKGLGVVAGVIAAGFDLYHLGDEAYKGHAGLAIAYGLSGLAGIWISVAVVAAIPVAGTFIAALILIGTAIYLAFNNRDNIQKWLVQCLWRTIPVDPDDTKEDQDTYMKREAADLPIWPTMQMEMDELKLALDSEG